jgi:hypothetical protein
MPITWRGVTLSSLVADDVADDRHVVAGDDLNASARVVFDHVPGDEEVVHADGLDPVLPVASDDVVGDDPVVQIGRTVAGVVASDPASDAAGDDVPRDRDVESRVFGSDASTS